eukprot:CAMPEP_0204236890 /NCGR_PEP_ID=MMETSP0361-20130328/92827_1 /ASSEMBLY_ACC=CAM_ASM_000343 /TAXON_ID=268821 /ORGANISM="Scrippsiella Hangoei, Strain SHTV-5" /LENGTH=74 /DNA_ID=CAMNT_0051209123 /DNA_START=25 /DNA_END=245 /DNA_ORIENTATION=-
MKNRDAGEAGRPELPVPDLYFLFRRSLNSLLGFESAIGRLVPSGGVTASSFVVSRNDATLAMSLVQSSSTAVFP